MLDESTTKIQEHFRINRRLIASVVNKIREYISLNLNADPIRLGGLGKVCQIDESLFSHKVKAHRGRAPREQIWVFGVADVSFRPARFHLEVVPDRSADTLLPIIARVCRPGTEVHSDEWAAYRRIYSRTGLVHRTVNHSLNFVDPASGIHTQNIESCWAQCKQRIKAMKGIRRDLLASYVAELNWRSNYCDNLRLALFALLKARFD